MRKLVKCPRCRLPGVENSFLACGCPRPTSSQFVLHTPSIISDGRIFQSKPIDTSCIHRGDRVGPAACGCSGKPSVHWCNLLQGHCTVHATAKPWRKTTEGVARVGRLDPCVLCEHRTASRKLLDKNHPRWHFITVDELSQDVANMAGYLPPLSGVAGVPVSGMLAAPLLSTLLHIPLYEASNQHGMRLIGHGSRGGSREVDPNDPILVLDDTVSSGCAMRNIREKLGVGNYLYGAVYSSFSGVSELDYFGTYLDHPHLLEWNLANTGYINSLGPEGEFNGSGIAIDFDGVLCPDPPRIFDESDPAERQAYLDWLTNAPLSKFVPRMFSIPEIVSYRCEYTRPATEAWLAKHRIKYEKLTLWPDTPQSRPFDARFKADAYAARDFGLFIESAADQAAAIAAATGKRVLCTDTRTMI